MPPAPGQAMPRPFLLGVIMMLLLISMQSDWNDSRSLSSSAKEGQERILKEGVHEKIIYELSIDNERLEREVAQLKQYVLDVRRAARKCGCGADILKSEALLTLYPEFHPDYNSTNSTAPQPGSSPEAAAGGGEARGEAAAISAKLESIQGAGNGTAGAIGGGLSSREDGSGGRQAASQQGGRRRLAAGALAGGDTSRGSDGENGRLGPGWALEGLAGDEQEGTQQ